MPITTTGLDDLMSDISNLPSELQEVLEDTIAQQAIAFNEDLRGSGPGEGITPFASGNLLLSGNLDHDGRSVVFTNDADYASYAHRAGGSTGDYDLESGEAFRTRFDSELTEELDRAVGDLLDK